MRAKVALAMWAGLHGPFRPSRSAGVFLTSMSQPAPPSLLPALIPLLLQHKHALKEQNTKRGSIGIRTREPVTIQHRKARARQDTRSDNHTTRPLSQISRVKMPQSEQESLTDKKHTKYYLP